MAPLLPPLVSLRAFEAAARHMSMSLAAEELCVTPGAVSLQIKELEAALGLKLFVRKPRALELTVEGQTYFASLKVAFRMLREATEVVRQTTRARVITVSCTSTIAVQWLVPKLARFEAENPGLDVRISISHRLVDFARDAVDLAIRHGLGRYDGLISERLLDDELTPVAAPAVAAGLSSVEALSGLTLLHDETRDDWRLWLAAVGAERVEASGGPIFTAAMARSMPRRPASGWRSPAGRWWQASWKRARWSRRSHKAWPTRLPIFSSIRRRHARGPKWRRFAIFCCARRAGPSQFEASV